MQVSSQHKKASLFSPTKQEQCGQKSMHCGPSAQITQEVRQQHQLSRLMSTLQQRIHHQHTLHTINLPDKQRQQHMDAEGDEEAGEEEEDVGEEAAEHQQ